MKNNASVLDLEMAAFEQSIDNAPMSGEGSPKFWLFNLIETLFSDIAKDLYVWRNGEIVPNKKGRPKVNWSWALFNLGKIVAKFLQLQTAFGMITPPQPETENTAMAIPAPGGIGKSRIK